MLCQDCNQYEFTQEKDCILITERCKLDQDWSGQEGLQGCTLRKSTIEKMVKEKKKKCTK